jgi:ubiquinone/menaquinone biosynthesis C-methylase UbiE
MAERLYHTMLAKRVLERRRRARVKYMLSQVDSWPGMSVLDVGCGPDGRSFESCALNEYRVTGIDIFPPQDVTFQHAQFRYHQQDARDLSRFEANSFDLAISIGMMEHICERDTLEQIASEMMRVSRQWIVGVPWRFCCLEPHFKFPFFQLLPESWQVLLARQLNLHNLGSTVAQDSTWIKHHYQWLPSHEWKRIFKANKVCVLPMCGDLLVIKSNCKGTAPGFAGGGCVRTGRTC